jgi:hypothetical protein
MPPAQCWPAAQAALPPQVQLPPAEQPSAVTPQFWHALPPLSHWLALVAVTQVPLLQQPEQPEHPAQV